jgi:hypothetical protein
VVLLASARSNTIAATTHGIETPATAKGLDEEVMVLSTKRYIMQLGKQRPNEEYSRNVMLFDAVYEPATMMIPSSQ